MRKVIHVLTDNNIGGAGRWLLNELRCTDRTKYDVSVLLPEGSLLRAQVEELGFRQLCVPDMRESSWDGASLGGMTALFRAERPDVVHVGASLTARAAARCARVPALVVTKHCAVERGGSALARGERAAADALLADRVIAVSHAVGEQLARAGTPRDKIAVIYNGIMPAAPYEGGARESLRESLGFDREHLWVGIAARLERVKGVDLFLDTARRVLAERDDVRFAVFGSGSQEEALRRQAAGLDGVRFMGFCDEIEQALGLLDVAVVSSRSEAFCLSAAEALSMGTPVAAFDVDGVSEVVRGGETGLLAPAENTAALAAQITRLLDDPALRQSLGERGRALVLREFTAEKMARRTEALYDMLLGKKGK